MTVYKNLKRKEEILRGAAVLSESLDMRAMWLAKARELQKKIAEMTIEEAEGEC